MYLIRTLLLSLNVLMNTVESCILPFSSNPSTDLRIISPSHASVISKDWLNVCDDIPDYIENSINVIEAYISDHRGIMEMYLSWSPENGSGFKMDLFLVCCTVKPSTRMLKINHIVQNPLWKPELINSLELKKALECFNERLDCAVLDYSEIKENMPRYYMSWFPREIAEKR